MSYLNCKRWKGKKMKTALPKDKNFQIWKDKSPLSIAHRVSLKMLKKIYIQHYSFEL